MGQNLFFLESPFYELPMVYDMTISNEHPYYSFLRLGASFGWDWKWAEWINFFEVFFPWTETTNLTI